MKPTPLLIAALAILASPLPAQVIGVEDFSYAGTTTVLIAGQTGGIGFNYDLFDDTTTTTPSDWDATGGDPEVIAGALVTNTSSAKREYNGDIEGAGGAANDGQDDHERSGAVRGTGRVFYKVDLTRSSGAVWSGLSSYDFGAERIFFGVPGAGGATDTVGIEESGVGTTLSPTGLTLTDGTTHTLIAMIDFDFQQLALWVDPNPNDCYDTVTGINTADVVRAYTVTNWSTALRLGSGGEATWDNLTVAIEPTEVGLFDGICDGDGDGLPTEWENNNGLDDTDDGTIGETSAGAKDGPNGALGDPDGDDATNAQELSEGTDPQDPDSDDDQLSDGAEINTWFSDPLDPDSDDDCLTDAEEVITHDTDPNAADTDGGGTNDFTEIAVGTDPQVFTDDPTGAGDPVVIGIEFFDEYASGTIAGTTGGTGWDHDNSLFNDDFIGHTTKTSDWTNVGGTPFTVSGRLVTQGTSAKREFHGGPSPGEVAGEGSGAFLVVGGAPTENGSDVLYMKVELTRRAGADWSGMSLYDFGSEEIFIGVPSPQYDPDGAGPLPPAFTFGIEETGVDRSFAFEFGDTTSPILPVTDQTHVIVARLDFDTTTVRLFVDPDLSGPEPANADAIYMPDPSSMNGTAVRLGSGGGGQTIWDGLVVTTAWSGLGVVAEDLDSDGMPDAWEIINFGNTTTAGPGTNNDADSLTDLEEYQNGTDPNDEDTDDDTLNDDVEINTTGTSPFLADTDGDTIRDDEELVEGADGYITNPLLVDSDGDGGNDQDEIFYGSDPTDPDDLFGGDRDFIGCDDFESYGETPIGGLVGGVGWDADNSPENDVFYGHTGTFSDWTNTIGAPTVASGQLLTLGSAVKREFNGPTEGAEAGMDERSGAVNAEWLSNVIYIRFDMTRSAGATWGGVSLMDFGEQLLEFGVVDNAGTWEFGLNDIKGGAGNVYNTTAPIVPIAGQAYTLVGKFDFISNELAMWIDPDLDDTEANNPPYIQTVRTPDNWASGIRPGSGGTGATAWDNVFAGHTWESLTKVVVIEQNLVLRALGFDQPGNFFNVRASGLVPGSDYHFQSFDTVGEAWVDLVGTTFNAAAAIEDRDIPTDEDVIPVDIIRLIEGPGP